MDMNKYNLSVIVPVYNTGRYLERCLSSLTSQTLENIEIVVVNDGSTDNSPGIIKSFSRNYENIKVITTQNSGISTARRIGIENAASEYICFVDSDDFVAEDFCMQLYNAVSINAADCGECGYYSFSDLRMKTNYLFQDNLTLGREEFRDLIIKGNIIAGRQPSFMWNKIYKKEIIVSYVLDYGECALEDYLFNMQYYAGVTKYVYINKPLYYYRGTLNSITKTFNPRLFDILLKVQEYKEGYMQALGLNDEECRQASYSWFMGYIGRIVYRVYVYKNAFSRKQKKELVVRMLTNPKVLMVAGNIKLVPGCEEEGFILQVKNKLFDKIIFKQIIYKNKAQIIKVIRKLLPKKYKSLYTNSSGSL
ncbi:putative glycosyltransferase EpsH [Ruminiclostridium hungatei]|uniref:Putative glycosyltransferase EpsH n=1 Tax=Ruminiclostridium hungatei TaxID=48256 RepID=A0A1V4SK53_RUMHU|nr:glycosyltransferase family 2 protein [Ruminiclostridium hungatei]OPX44194.1 putative glycosyltransferase EpsH [Ruminiclostridium hungatei]